jgi:hypothetical protein
VTAFSADEEEARGYSLMTKPPRAAAGNGRL